MRSEQKGIGLKKSCMFPLAAITKHSSWGPENIRDLLSRGSGSWEFKISEGASEGLALASLLGSSMALSLICHIIFPLCVCVWLCVQIPPS